MVRRLPKGQETRERILAEALRLFAAQGYARVSVEEIADAAGVTKGAVYHWFTDKDDLGRELQHDLYERLSFVSLRALDPEARDLYASWRVESVVLFESLLGRGPARYTALFETRLGR